MSDLKPLSVFPGAEQPQKKTQREILAAKVAAKKDKEKRQAAAAAASSSAMSEDADDTERAPPPLSDEEKAALAKKRNRQRWISVVGFFSIVPIAFSMPYVIGFVLDVTRDRSTSDDDCFFLFKIYFLFGSRLFEADLGFGGADGGGAVFLQEKA